MPELPEVETIRRQLQRQTPWPIEEVEYSSVAAGVLKKRHFNPAGKTIESVRRHGKMLAFQLAGGGRIVSHLGMSGSWRLAPAEKHTHVLFKGPGGKQLAYVDPRRFGKIYYLSEEAFRAYKKKLGVDVSSSRFNGAYIHQVFKRHPARQLKPFLLEQHLFAGIGNYMACEICARAGLRPTRRLGRIGKKGCEAIADATRSLLQSQLSRRGLSFSGGYRDVYGNDGGGLSNLMVFHQELCGLCEATRVKKIVLAGRGTFYCPRCQD